jgi:hypothetical protein
LEGVGEVIPPQNLEEKQEEEGEGGEEEGEDCSGLKVDEL